MTALRHASGGHAGNSRCSFTRSSPQRGGLRRTRMHVARVAGYEVDGRVGACGENAHGSTGVMKDHASLQHTAAAAAG